MRIRFGILGTAHIANRVADAIESSGHQVYAIASRDLERAKQWVSGRTSNKDDIICYGSYDQLIEDDQVQAVYIPLPSSLADCWAQRAANSGKHILVDKPFSSAENVLQITQLCRRNNLAFLDGTQFVHGPRLKEMQNMIQSGAIGRLRKVNAAFTAWIVDSTNIRYDPSLEPAGCVGDVGWYVVRFILSFVGYDRKVISVYAVGNETDHGAMDDCCGVVQFEDNITAHFDCGFTSGYRQWGECLGTLGMFRVDRFQGAPIPNSSEQKDPNLHFQFRQVGEERNGRIERVEKETKDIWVPSVGKPQSVLLIEQFVTLIEKQDKEEREKWAKEAWKTQLLVDAIYQSAKTKQTILLL
ncbi:Uncharacterized oxidoreductase [Galdieria sulphuraria]|uniref:Oxidoreductase family protein n=1 Tax=Galdieria sulphuraria TaxID=130081 RepID=M2W3T8_GALSU|nr:oxidoreductase family protein [Galdieria sulphuraria]EME30381.1 oxidoreductase family protein [Galdieria sulphuraria]GJD08604.1 Uncharacterized oxidoreductase [Galdieria sulphuraria]|eukprot:XP_005706901.1 oxidoreductase family protein [Galdieria sulphuraria]